MGRTLCKEDKQINTRVGFVRVAVILLFAENHFIVAWLLDPSPTLLKEMVFLRNWEKSNSNYSPILLALNTDFDKSFSDCGLLTLIR